MKKHQDRIRRAKTPDQKAEHYRTYQKEKDRLQIQMKNLREKVEKNL
ncbi:hypothetical protein [Halalkalibacterium halodurans]|nr:hypothetical protein [Halalkalibacterium halodurans]MDY7222073.1 hypothetical protein [Halalkalibacterium halodurans]MDY7243908.1 hypothetical protein [Halalkalibacterium halodurans]